MTISAAWGLPPFSRYAEFRIDDSVGFEGQESSSVGVLGLKYKFSWKATHNP